MKRNDGKQLQDLVAYVEKALIGAGYLVETNVFEYDSDGNLAAEFDIRFTGTEVNTGFTWLIECRDRPSEGAAPGKWIEQLVGRRIRFGFNKVTAVSTTGFAAAAAKWAVQEGIELKETLSLEPSEFSWLGSRNAEYGEYRHRLEHASVIADGDLDEAREAALREVLQILLTPGGSELPIIRDVQANTVVSFMRVCYWASEQAKLRVGLVPNGASKPFHFIVDMLAGESVFEIDTRAGAIRIAKLELVGYVQLKQQSVPITMSKEYRDSTTGEILSQSVGSEPQQANGMMTSIELHNIPATGRIQVAIRTTPVEPKDRT